MSASKMSACTTLLAVLATAESLVVSVFGVSFLALEAPKGYLTLAAMIVRLPLIHCWES